MGASSQPADKLTRRVQEMVTLFGFITVVDTASFPGYHRLSTPSHRIRRGAGASYLYRGRGLFPQMRFRTM